MSESTIVAELRTWLLRGRDQGSSEVPVQAAIISPEGEIVAEGHNSRDLEADPTAHAEILAIRAAASLRGDWRLDGYTIFSTLEPCLMCSTVIRESRISRVIFLISATSPSADIYDVLRDQRLPGKPPEVIKLAEASLQLPTNDLSIFFAGLRRKSAES